VRIPRTVYKFSFVFILLFFPSAFCFAQLQRSSGNGAVTSNLDLVEIEREMIMERQLLQSEPAPVSAPMPVQPQNPPRAPAPRENSMLLGTIYLNDAFPDLLQPVEIEKGNYIRIVGQGIKRFLVTEPNFCSVEKQGFDELYVTGQQIGYTYVHVWDNQGRWGIAFLTIPPKPQGITVAEEMKRKEEETRNFKLRYVMDWTSFEQGKDLNNLRRLTYTYFHSLTLEGPTPYGDLDSSVTVRNFNGETDLSYGTVGLEHGSFGDYKGFSLRVFDFHPEIGNLSFYDIYQRGVLLKSPAFDNRVHYTAFWGRELPSILGPTLAPGVSKKSLKSFLGGFNVNVSPQEKQTYRASIFRGWGEDREKLGLHQFGYDAGAEYNLDPWIFDYEAAFDSKKFANLLTAIYKVPQLRFSTEVRDSAKDFQSMSGIGYRAGERGVLSSVTYVPSSDFKAEAHLDVFQDRRFGNLEHPDYWNQDFRGSAVYTLDSKTSFGADYMLQNDLGKIGAFRYLNAGLGANHSFEFIRKCSAFMRFSRQENKNFSAPTLDYINEKANIGFRVNLLGALYYYLNGEYNWLKEVSANVVTHPLFYETGLDWSERLFKSPLYLQLLLTYRNEENTSSPLSFLSGQDYIEGYTELTWRQNQDTEVYCSSRIRNTWAERQGVLKGVEADFRAGLRYLWDTGFHWDPVGSVYGYVFRDLNDDGLMQRDEAPVEGVRVTLGKGQSQVTDLFGYYCFPRVRGRKTHVDIDVASLPPGFVLTGPATQSVGIVHSRSGRIDFGVISRSEITGVIFEDKNGNSKLDQGETGIRGITVILENGTKSITDNSGTYYFRKIAVGRHTVTLDLKSLPTSYIPSVAIFKDIELFEGVSYVYNVPLKRVQE
jgi:hypothetical protein